MSPKDAAFMMDEALRDMGYLDQSHAVHHILNYDKNLTYENDEGGTSISRKVLEYFNKINNEDVVWSRSALCWRLRMPYDVPSRRIQD
jgi:hypothetical protein